MSAFSNMNWVLTGVSVREFCLTFLRLFALKFGWVLLLLTGAYFLSNGDATALMRRRESVAISMILFVSILLVPAHRLRPRDGDRADLLYEFGVLTVVYMAVIGAIFYDWDDLSNVPDDRII